MLLMCPLRGATLDGMNRPPKQLGQQCPPILGGRADVVDRIRKVEKMIGGLTDRRVFTARAKQRCVSLGAPQRLRPEAACCQSGLRANSVTDKGHGDADRKDPIVAIDPRELEVMTG